MFCILCDYEAIIYAGSTWWKIKLLNLIWRQIAKRKIIIADIMWKKPKMFLKANKSHVNSWFAVIIASAWNVYETIAIAETIKMNLMRYIPHSFGFIFFPLLQFSLLFLCQKKREERERIAKKYFSNVLTELHPRKWN